MRIHITSLGCPRNWVDTEQMLTFLLKDGHKLIGEEEKADVLLINTCGFLKESRKEAIETIEELLQRKRSDAKVIVTGCMVQNHKEEIEKRFKGKIHFYLGSGDIDQILKAIHSKEKGEYISKRCSFINMSVPRVIATPSHFAYVKIAEGCSKNCSYCIIPKIKGPLKSRSSEHIIREIETLLSDGVKEIILVAQDLADFGKDRKEEKALCTLLEEILAIKKDFWLRLLYVYPDDMPKDLINIMSKDSRVCRYIDMPIQHVSDKILRKMKRKTSKEKIIHTIETLREKMPDISIRTSLIVGFPSETEEDFQQLVDFLKTYKLDHVGIFTYSREELSSSYDLEDQIPEDVKKKRAEILTKVQLDIAKEKNQKKLGKVVKAIVEGYHNESSYLALARSQKQAPEIDSQIIINDVSKIKKFGQFADVEITAAIDFDLIGQIKD